MYVGWITLSRIFLAARGTRRSLMLIYFIYWSTPGLLSFLRFRVCARPTLPFFFLRRHLGVFAWVM